VAAALDVAQEFHDFEIEGARVVVQGFGSVGKHAARFLRDRGARLVGVADSRGARANADGFDLDALIAFKDAGGSVAEFHEGDAIERDGVIDIACEIWIPAARPDVLRADNIDRLKTRVVAEGANIPATMEAEKTLAARGVLVIPDFIANAGGVICAAVEYAGGTQAQAFEVIDEKIRANTREVLSTAKQSGRLPRAVAMDLARDRITRAMKFRRTF
jgi:glutamate dehydrogenase/leucine dehydrogenase